VSLLRVEGLTVRYGGVVLGVDGVSFEVPAAGTVALLGANGAGKTTILRAVSGLLKFHGGVIERGAIYLDGHNVVGADCSQLVAKGVAQVLEGRRVFAELTVADNLRAGGFAVQSGSAAVREQILELFPILAQRFAQPAGLLSGGEQQMLAIGRALMARPRLLLLDEPSLGLAPLVVQRIADTLKLIHEEFEVAILLVDQSTALALAVTENAHLLENGRLIHSAPTPDLLADERCRAAYLGTRAGGELVAAEIERL
jgi:ABC-type branched-subunit amino acid transport system ATPase component